MCKVRPANVCGELTITYCNRKYVLQTEICVCKHIQGRDIMTLLTYTFICLIHMTNYALLLIINITVTLITKSV